MIYFPLRRPPAKGEYASSPTFSLIEISDKPDSKDLLRRLYGLNSWGDFSKIMVKGLMPIKYDLLKKILKDIKITTVKSVDEVLKIALTKELKPIEWIEVDKLPNTKGAEKTTTGSAH